MAQRFSIQPTPTDGDRIREITQLSELFADELADRTMFPMQWNLYQTAAVQAMLKAATKSQEVQ